MSYIRAISAICFTPSQKADVLIISLTADRYNTKGAYRPHVPQDLRAMNLALFEIVDYVLIDENAEPLENLRTIEPDFFAKGFEYTSNLTTKTRAEAAIVEGYGGEIIFTPGDVVYSSSKLIETEPPDIKLAKLQSLMETAGVTFDKLRETLDRMKGKRVHVVGDTIVDTITYSHLIGASGKTPTMSVHIERAEHFVGGAAVVAKHVKAAGAEAIFSTVIGNDNLGKLVLDDLEDAGIELMHVVDQTRPTTNKNAVVAGGYRLLKMDTVDNRLISSSTANKLAAGLAETPADAFVFSDFRHGLFNRETIASLAQAMPTGCLKAADSQVASRWGNILDFQGFDLITPNEKEARFALGDQDSGIRALAWQIYDAARCKCLIMKLGKYGTLTRAGKDSFALDSFAGQINDPVGAGDALLAYATLAMLTSQCAATATILGTLAAGLGLGA